MTHRIFKVNGQVTDRIDTYTPGAAISDDETAAAEVAAAAGVAVETVAVEHVEDLPTIEVVIPPTAVSVPPDSGGLLLAIFAALGKGKARAVATKYPDFQIGLDRRNWPVARAAVADALTAGDLTQAQYDTILPLFATYGIP